LSSTRCVHRRPRSRAMGAACDRRADHPAQPDVPAQARRGRAAHVPRLHGRRGLHGPAGRGARAVPAGAHGRAGQAVQPRAQPRADRGASRCLCEAVGELTAPPQVLATINTLAVRSMQRFEPFAAGTLGLCRTIMGQTGAYDGRHRCALRADGRARSPVSADDTVLVLRCKATECAGGVGYAIGKAKFAPCAAARR
jgi:hypothetical protein